MFIADLFRKKEGLDVYEEGCMFMDELLEGGTTKSVDTVIENRKLPRRLIRLLIRSCRMNDFPKPTSFQHHRCVDQVSLSEVMDTKTRGRSTMLAIHHLCPGYQLIRVIPREGCVWKIKHLWERQLLLSLFWDQPLECDYNISVPYFGWDMELEKGRREPCPISSIKWND